MCVCQRANRQIDAHMAIANDLGTAREVVSRILKDFERNNEVELGRNSIHLLSL